MSRSEKPTLSPEGCYSAQSIRRFLLLSRSLTDDSVSADLNSLPVQQSSTELGSGKLWRKPERERAGAPRRLCKDYVSTSVFESWKARDDVLEYCTSVAESRKSEVVAAFAQREKVDPRIDPYAARDIPEVTKEDQMLSWIQNEREIEDIVRNRTWSVIEGKCSDFSAPTGATDSYATSGWKTVYSEWKSAK
ncbi:caffeine-induced death protein 2 [Myxozyma melibiosi]|uniref:Caffeine-induced death protein 2 n=1 Tax=Myxozyma melibiosi TaxID=54550 RepID=A0ABR1F3S5_9ASCO